MTPALLMRASRRVEEERNVEAEEEMVVRSERSRWRYVREPWEFGARVCMEEMAVRALGSERAAMWTVALWR